MQNLEWLGLDETQITDAGLKEVAKLQKLEWLGLDETQITDAGLKEVVKLQKLSMEETTLLSLDRTQITDAGLKEVASCRNRDAAWLTIHKSPTRASRRWLSCRISKRLTWATPASQTRA